MLEREAMAVLVSTAGISYGRREMALRAAGSAEAILADPGAYAAQLTQEGAASLQKMIRGGGIGKTLDALKEETPLGVLGTPEQVADAVVFLASPAAGFITGQIVGVNGGFGE